MNITVSVAHLKKKKNQNLKAYLKKPTRANNQEKKYKYKYMEKEEIQSRCIV